MSNLFKINIKNEYTNKNIINNNEINNNKKIKKYFPVSTREWNNSIYSFNRNTLSLIPQSSKISSKLVRDYLKASNLKIRYKLPKTYLTRKQKRLTSNRIYVSNGEFKHTNDKVLIVLYTYNKERYNYIKILAKKYLYIIKNRKRFKIKFFHVKARSIRYLKKINRNKYNIIKIIRKNNVNLHLINFYKKWIKKCTRIIKKYLFIKQLLYINSSKYNYTYLQILKNYVEKIQNKKVEFNLINIRYNYLNSDILLKSIALKVTKNRKKYKKYIRKPTLRIEAYKNREYKDEYDNIEILRKIESEVNLKKTILENIKYKRVSGIRIQIAGRLTKRIKASRALKTIKYRGNLKDNVKWIKSKVILKGNLRSNLQYTRIKSKTRIGSFGIKGWVSGN